MKIAGGCCGNTPEHIAAIAKALEGLPPREIKTPSAIEPAPASVDVSTIVEDPRPLRLSGSQPFTQQDGVYMMIGERTNVAGSPKFAKLIKEGQYREAVIIAPQQIANDATAIDGCID